MQELKAIDAAQHLMILTGLTSMLIERLLVVWSFLPWGLNLRSINSHIIALQLSLILSIPPVASEAETVICSKFDTFNSRVLNEFLGAKSERGISDWSEIKAFPNDLSKIVIAIPKNQTDEIFECIEQADRLIPGVKSAILEGVAAVGSKPDHASEVIIGPLSGEALFGPVMTDIRYVRSATVTVQVIVTDNPEPTRSIRALERFFDLPLGYCEHNNNCGLEYKD